MSKTYNAQILFDDEDKAPVIVLAGTSNANIVREKIREMFYGGFVVTNDVAVVEESNKAKITVVEKYFSMDEVDHIELVETEVKPQESKETIDARKAAKKAAEKAKKG